MNKLILKHLIISLRIYLFHNISNHFMIPVSAVPKWKNNRHPALSNSVGGPNMDLEQPIALVWSRFFWNMVAPISEDLKELFRELATDNLDLYTLFENREICSYSQGGKNKNKIHSGRDISYCTRKSSAELLGSPHRALPPQHRRAR